MGQRVPGVTVAAVLAHDDVRPEGGREVGDQALDRAKPAAFAGLRLERDIDDGSRGRPIAQLVEGAGPREQVLAGFVE